MLAKRPMTAARKLLGMLLAALVACDGFLSNLPSPFPFSLPFVRDWEDGRGGRRCEDGSGGYASPRRSANVLAFSSSFSRSPCTIACLGLPNTVEVVEVVIVR